MVRPCAFRTRRLTGLLGAWLIAAPFVLAYNANADAPQAVANDIIVGLLVVLLAGISAGITLGSRRKAGGER